MYYGKEINKYEKTKILIVIYHRYGAKLVHDKKLTAGLLASFLMYMLQVALAFAFLASLFGGM